MLILLWFWIILHLLFLLMVLMLIKWLQYWDTAMPVVMTVLPTDVDAAHSFVDLIDVFPWANIHGMPM
jgi:hypothetical protein